MAIVVRQDVRAEFGSTGSILLEVRSGSPAARPALEHLAGVLGARFVSPPFALPGGHLLMIDPGAADLRAAPDLIAERLRAAGVDDAELAVPTRIGRRYETIQALAPAARAWLRAPLAKPYGEASRTPPLWLAELVLEWAGTDPIAVVVSAEVTAGPDVVAAAVSSAAPTAVVASDFATWARAGAVGAGPAHLTPAATLTASGDVVAHLRAQRDIALAHAERLVWAGVTAVPDARDLLSAELPADVGTVVDLVVPDALWCQILSPGHVERLGGPPAGARELPGGRWELLVGEPEQWVPGHRDLDRVRASARELLAACLVDSDEAFSLTRQRMQEARARDDEGFFPRGRRPRR
ncbi:hypothetical protein ACWEIJ_25330 [Lentzea sp. NPDC004789]